MASLLPDEIWVDILDYLEPTDIVSSQRVSSRLLKLARDNRLWRYKCFEKAPSAAAINADRPDALANLTGALGGLSLSESPRPAPAGSSGRPRPSKRARKVAEWDHSSEREDVDWYSEYISRSAPLSTIWCGGKSNNTQEVRGVALHEDSQKVVGCIDDGSVCIWDIRDRPYSRRKFDEVGRSPSGILFQTHSTTAQTSTKRHVPAFKGVVECVNVDSHRQKAFCAVEQTLNEVDLETLQVVSRSMFAWPITALSQQGELDVPLSVGTSWSLHLYDVRAPMRDRSRSPEDLLRTTPGDPEDSIAFLPNYAKASHRDYNAKALPTTPAPILTQMMGSTARQPRRTRTDLSDYAHMEPGPLSIIHPDDNEIFIAGRFPSILSYDRRAFPRLQYVMHSGARLSCLTTIPHPTRAARTDPRAQATLVACGEYGGRGSLELYSLPHDRRENRRLSGDFGLDNSAPDQVGAADREHALLSSETPPYCYKNRQEASTSKLLSVATQGTRIVFSDAEGGIKWVERDGRGLARRWNINSWQLNERGGSISGELAARKMVPLHKMESERGDRGDSDLLIWTGEKIGLITTKPQWEDHDELVKSLEDKLDLGEHEEHEKAEEYAKTMRRALERQADERRWMSQFRLKRGLF